MIQRVFLEVDVDIDDNIISVDDVISMLKSISDTKGINVKFIDKSIRRDFQVELLSYFNEYLQQHPELRNKQYIYKDKRLWTPQEIYERMVKDVLFLREFEKDLLKLSINLIMRNKENIDGFTIRSIQ